MSLLINLVKSRRSESEAAPQLSTSGFQTRHAVIIDPLGGHVLEVEKVAGRTPAFEAVLLQRP